MPASFADLARLIRGHADIFADAVRGRLAEDLGQAAAAPALRAAEPTVAHAAAWVLEHNPEPRSGHLPVLSDEVAARLAAVARAERRHGLPAARYAAQATALRAGLRAALKAAGAHYTLAAARAEDLAEVCCAHMADADLADARAGVPAASSGQVISVERPARRIAVISVDTGLPVAYTPGQRLPTTATYTPGVWVPLAPALPADAMGQLRFHLDLSADCPVHDLGRARVGDQWVFGRPEGGLRLNPADPRPVTMIAHGTGWAPLRALVTALLSARTRPEVHVVLHAEYPGELYDLPALAALAAATSWLTVTATAAHPADAWWVHSAVALPADGSGVGAVTTVAEPVEAAGDLTGHRVIVAGLPEAAAASAAAARAAGAADVQVEDFSPAFSWD
ncbi:hypothetical protein [Corynebacterium frankenforstense]|uniref:hypothetical protein n=1 Tax=Corynebacterium frankenforstense TaxID=1230998 RepID=UPI0026ED73DE|nr:hypothetical protein [Corynebacterium frankenforstense]